MSIFTKYRFRQKIGRGHSSVIYECIHKGTGEVYACKILHSPKNIKRSNNEIALLQNCRHQHINKIYDVYEEDGNIYLNL